MKGSTANDLVAIVSIVLLALVSGIISEQGSTNATCLCLTGTNVKAHSIADVFGTVVGVVSKPECYLAITGDGGSEKSAAAAHTWYELQNVEGRTGWVDGRYLVVSSDTNCVNSSTGVATCNDTVAQDYACKLLHLAERGTVTLWREHTSGIPDNAVAYNNIADTCKGHAAARSHYPCPECRSPGAPGGHVCLSATVLHYIYKLHDRLGYIHVNELAGECHPCGSAHYEGRAVDLHTTASQASAVLSLCRLMGGSSRKDGDHIHCQFT